MSNDANPDLRSALPPDDALRELLHNEVHARPAARIKLPALLVYIAVLNEGVTRAEECAHLRLLPGQSELSDTAMQGNFLRLRLDRCHVKWERHSEFTRYTVVQPLPQSAWLGSVEPELFSALRVDPEWLRGIPGRTVAAIKLALVEHDINDPHSILKLGQQWLGGRNVVASILGQGHSIALTGFRLLPSGFERMLVIAPAGLGESRAGRISQRLLELETYRLMALRALPVAKSLAPMLAASESALAEITACLETMQESEQHLLDRLIHVAASVERATAEHMYRFSATQAYAALVRQRIDELREAPIPGTQTIGDFMQRRLSPAIATAAATAQRLASLSQRTERASSLLRTRVDIATENQNQQLLAQLTRGQQLQLKLQTTVEGLSIAAISYYVVSLLLYAGKAMRSAGLDINPELAAGAAVPVVLWCVWKATQRVHAKLYRDD